MTPACVRNHSLIDVLPSAEGTENARPLTVTSKEAWPGILGDPRGSQRDMDFGRDRVEEGGKGEEELLMRPALPSTRQRDEESPSDEPRRT